MPLFKVPIHASYILYLAQFSRFTAINYWRMALTMCRMAGVAQTLPVYHVGCVSPTDARYASPFARESAKTGEIS